MRQGAREALRETQGLLRDALDPEYGADAFPEENPQREAVESALDKVTLLLERADVEAEVVQHLEGGQMVKVKTTRGVSVRDQDEWTFVGRGETAEEAVSELDAELDAYMSRIGEKVRGFDPYEGGDE